jgi:hypothetical protein
MFCNGKCGGMASLNSGTISKSYADLTITGNSVGPAGLIAGQNYSGHIENCYAKGSITAPNAGTIGGLVGLNEQWISNGDIVKSYASVDFKNTAGVGGIIGWQYQGGGQSATYWDTEVSGTSVMCGSTDWNDPSSCTNTNGLPTSLMKTASSYVGWNFEDVWGIDSTKNDGYPFLRGVPVYVPADQNTDDEEETIIVPATKGGGGALMKSSSSSKSKSTSKPINVLPSNDKTSNEIIVRGSEDWEKLLSENLKLQKQISIEEQKLKDYENEIYNLIKLKEIEIKRLIEEKRKASLWMTLNGFLAIIGWLIPVLAIGIGVACFFNPGLAFIIMNILSKIVSIAAQIFDSILDWIYNIIDLIKQWNKN